MGYTLFLAAVLIFGLLFVAQLLAGKPQAFPYEKQEALFSPAERSFLGVLEQSVGAQYRIVGKVRLADIIHVRKNLPASQQMAARNRINQKHVDFVLCDPRTLQIVGIIELDDRSHQRPDRQARDRFVDSALAAAGMPILHVVAQRSYNAAQLQKQIRDAFVLQSGV